MISSWEFLPFTDLDLQSPIFEKISRSMAVPDMTPEPYLALESCLEHPWIWKFFQKLDFEEPNLHR